MPLQVSIASPCSEAWAAMPGDERVRACAKCRLNVFNVASLSEAEVLALFRQSGTRVCGRVYQRRDGTVLTRDCPRGLRRKAVLAAAVVVTLAAALVGVRGTVRCELPEAEEGSWFTQLFEARFIAAREALRATETFGPLIDELSPRRFTTGRMTAIVPSSGS